MSEILAMQKTEANSEFSKFVVRNYEDWIGEKTDAPTMSHNLMRRHILPEINEKEPVIMLLLDNLRFDQWKTIEPIINNIYRVESEDYFYSILPTSTQYSRNAIFAGMLPGDIAKHNRKLWLNDNEKGGKNMHEAEFLGN